MQLSPIFYCGYAPGSIDYLKCPIKVNCPKEEIEEQQEKKWNRRG